MLLNNKFLTVPMENTNMTKEKNTDIGLNWSH